jgi:ribosomal 30S subunit maturation factor RimM
LFFGKLVDVLNLPSNDVYVIIKNDGSEVLVPAVKKYILDFNLDKNKMYLDSECKNFIDDEN